MYQDYKDLLSAFRSHGVRYLVVEGFAVGFHAAALYKRLGPFRTGRLCKRTSDVCRACGVRRSAESHQPGGLRRPRQFFPFREPHGFDILPSIPGVDFDAAWERRIAGVIDPATGFKALFISREDLIASKLASGRKRDLMDVEDIQEAAGSQRPKPAKKATRKRS